VTPLPYWFFVIAGWIIGYSWVAGIFLAALGDRKLDGYGKIDYAWYWCAILWPLTAPFAIGMWTMSRLRGVLERRASVRLPRADVHREL